MAFQIVFTFMQKLQGGKCFYSFNNNQKQHSDINLFRLFAVALSIAYKFLSEEEDESTLVNFANILGMPSSQLTVIETTFINML